MQLKLRRSQRESGILGKNVIFCLDARVDLSSQEEQSLTRYKLLNQVIYNSEASKKHLESAAAHRDGSAGGALKSLASIALAAMRLNITVASLQRGQHIECKSLDELLGAEDAIMEACETLRGYLDTAATFDGREILVSFDTGTPTIIAQASTPPPMLVTPASMPQTVAPPALAFTEPEGEEAHWEDAQGADDSESNAPGINTIHYGLYELGALVGKLRSSDHGAQIAGLGMMLLVIALYLLLG